MDKQQLEQLSKLSKVKLDKSMEDKLLEDLSAILDYVEKLSEVNTEGVESCYQVYQGDSCYLQEDEETAPLDLKEYLQNAPQHISSMIRTPPIIKF